MAFSYALKPTAEAVVEPTAEQQQQLKLGLDFHCVASSLAAADDAKNYRYAFFYHPPLNHACV